MVQLCWHTRRRETFSQVQFNRVRKKRKRTTRVFESKTTYKQHSPTCHHNKMVCMFQAFMESVSSRNTLNSLWFPSLLSHTSFLFLCLSKGIPRKWLYRLLSVWTLKNMCVPLSVSRSSLFSVFFPFAVNKWVTATQEGLLLLKRAEERSARLLWGLKSASRSETVVESLEIKASG